MKLPIIITILCCVLTADSSGPEQDLVFVVDQSDTVLQGIEQTMSDFFRKIKEVEQTRIHKYILVQFSDTEITDPVCDASAESFNHTLQGRATLNVRRGLNLIKCAGKSLTAIKKGLESSSPKSVIFVFTDAASSDDLLLPEIIDTIATTSSKVFFFLTKSNCNVQSHVKAYEKIALASNGQIFQLEVEHIFNLLKFHFPVMGPQRVDLLAVDGEIEYGQSKSFNFSVNEALSDILIVVSVSSSACPNLCIEVSGPHNTRVFGYIFPYHETTVKFYPYEKLDSGIYTIDLGNMDFTYSLRVSATSNVIFDYNFETYQNGDVHKISSQPVRDADNTFNVKLDNPSLIKSLSSSKIILPDGTECESFQLTPGMGNAASGLYYGSFKPTYSSFRLQINGMTTGDEIFQVTTPVLFSSSANYKDSRNTTSAWT